MNHNMSLYRRLNLRQLVQVGVSLNLLYWANVSNISLTSNNNTKRERVNSTISVIFQKAL